MKISEYPLIKCLPRIDFLGGMMFWCPYCKRMHLHGIGIGHRAPHCHNKKSPFNSDGYILKFFNIKEMKEIKKSIDEYLEHIIYIKKEAKK